MHTRRVSWLVAALTLTAVLPLSLIANRLQVTPLERGGWEEVPVSDLPTLQAAKVQEPIIVDGQLDEAVWQNAPATGPFTDLTNTPEAATEWVDARFAYDEEHLYLGARLHIPNEHLTATISANYGTVWKDDCLEIFLSVPGADDMYQLDINSKGVYWAGGHLPGVNWRPKLTPKTSVSDSSWTIELAIPWADLPMIDESRGPVACNLRYLIGGGWTAWTAGVRSPADSPTLLLESRGDTAKILFTRYRLPAYLPAGQSQIIALESKNIAESTGRIVVQTIDLNTHEQIARRIVDLPPGETVVTTLPITLAPSGQRQVAMLAKIVGEPRYRRLASHGITAIPPLALEPHRDGLWYGEQSVKVDLTIGRELAPESRLHVELWDDIRRLDQLRVQAESHAHHELTVDLRELPPATYRLRAVLQHAGKQEVLVRELTIRQAATLPARRQVPIRLDAAGDSPTLFFAGLSMPAGMLLDPQQVRIIDENGNELPSQLEVLARWSPQGSIKWLAARFLARPDQAVAFELGSDVRRSAPIASPVSSEETADSLLIDTGVARFELSKTGPLIRRGWLGENLLIDNQDGCLLIADQHGTVASEIHGQAANGPFVEVAGPLVTILKRQGLLKTAQGRRLGHYQVRLTFTAGSADVGIQHSFTNTEDTNEVQYSDLAFRIHPQLGDTWQVHLDDKEAHDEHAYETVIHPDRGEAAYLLQADHEHFFQPRTLLQIGLRRDGEWQTTDRADKAGNWAQVSSDRGGVALLVDNVAETFPKEFSAGPSGLTAHLWSSRGGQNLDYRQPAILDYIDPEWVEKGGFEGGKEAFLTLQTNAQSSARTHELALRLTAPAAPIAETAVAAARLDHPPLALQDPHWLLETDVLGPLHPYDPENFPRHEALLSGLWEVIADNEHREGNYGFLHYGNGPHSHKGGYSWEGRPRFYRYYNMDYQWRTVVWLIYARSGDRAYAEYASRYNRHLSDFLFSWWDTRSKPFGAKLMIGAAGALPVYWLSRPGNYGSQGVNVSNFLLMYYLRGDRRAQETVLNYGEFLADTFDPTELPDAVGGTNHYPYEMLAELYGHTWDERYGTLLRRSRERLITPETSSMLPDQRYYGSWYKPGTRMNARLKDYQVTGSKAAQESILFYCDWLLRQPIAFDPGYQDYSGTYMAYAWRWTGNRVYADWLHGRLDRTIASYTDAKANLTQDPLRGNQNLTFLQSLAHGMHLLEQTRGTTQPYPQLSPQGDDVYLRKYRDIAIELAFTHGKDLDLQLVQLADEDDEKKRGHYYVGPVILDQRPRYFSEEPAAGLIPEYSELLLQRDVLPADYRLTGLNTLLTTNADKLVRGNRDGFWLMVKGTEPPSWYTLIPAGVSSGLMVNKPLPIRDGENRLVVEPGAVHQLPVVDEDRLLVLQPTTRTFVRFTGDIPSVISPRRDRLFVPQANLKPIPLATIEDPAAIYVEGQRGQGLLLNADRRLTVPRGELVSGERTFRYIDFDQGTLEFWFKPQWTTNLLSEPVERNILLYNGWNMRYWNYMGDSAGGRGYKNERTQLYFRADAKVPIRPYAPQLHTHFQAIFDQGQWYHIALCWEYDEQDEIWRSALYVDGKPSENAGLTRYAYTTRWGKNWDVATPTRPFTFSGEANAIFDDIRISTIPRYRQRFDKPQADALALDDQTLLLVPLDGDLQTRSIRDTAPDAILQ